VPTPRPIPPAEVRRRLPPRARAAWLWAAFRDRIPQLPASSGPVTRSRRLADLVRAVRKAGLREHDPRVAALIASDPGGPEPEAATAVRLLAALVAEDEARSEKWLRQAHAELRRAAPRLEPHPRDHTFLHGLHALALGGLLFDDPGALAWRKSALPRYWDELQHQVLDDGTLRERCPALLGAALRDALAAHALWRAAGFVAPNEVHRRLRRMARAFGRLARPDLGTHRFGDTAPLDGAATGAILELARSGLGEDVAPPAGPWALPAGGFYGFTSPGGGVRLAVTTGRMALADLPAGEHADALSYELDLGGRPLVMDPGSAGGTAVGPALRGWARGTWAHNAVVVDGAFGTLAVGLFAQDQFSPNTTGNGLFYGGGAQLLAVQLAGVVVVGAFVAAASALAWGVLRAGVGIRVPAEEEHAGLDVGEHGISGYPEFHVSAGGSMPAAAAVGSARVGIPAVERAR